MVNKWEGAWYHQELNHWAQLTTHNGLGNTIIIHHINNKKNNKVWDGVGVTIWGFKLNVCLNFGLPWGLGIAIVIYPGCGNNLKVIQWGVCLQ